jgi:hypothetical protein
METSAFRIEWSRERFHSMRSRSRAVSDLVDPLHQIGNALFPPQRGLTHLVQLIPAEPNAL